MHSVCYANVLFVLEIKWRGGGFANGNGSEATVAAFNGRIVKGRQMDAGPDQ